MNNRYCIIMAGGIGSRFWPLSIKEKPKQFIDILSTGKSMIRETFERFTDIIPVENFIIVTNKAYKDLVKEAIPEIEYNQILCEPIKRNTAPCIAYAAHRIYSKNPDATMVVAPSDHYITNIKAFHSVINDCIEIAEFENSLMTIGICPNRPETGYGYIQIGDRSMENTYKVKTFTEKPDLEMAKIFLDSGEFLWNSGIFIWTCKSIIEAFDIYAPQINNVFAEGYSVYNTDKEQDFIDDVFSECDNISIDYAIMEKAKNVYVHEANFVWSDIGTWGSLYEHIEKDKNQNAMTTNRVKLYNTTNTIVKSDTDKVIVIDGLDDYIVVDSKEGLLICPMKNEQNIRKYIDE